MDQPRADDPDTRPDEAARPAQPLPGETGTERPAEALDLESLRRKVASQPTIEQAKGMLMAYYGIDAEEAFALLRRWSSSRHVKLRDLCRAVVAAGAAPGPRPYAGLRDLLDPLGPPGASGGPPD